MGLISANQGPPRVCLEVEAKVRPGVPLWASLSLKELIRVNVRRTLPASKSFHGSLELLQQRLSSSPQPLRPRGSSPHPPVCPPLPRLAWFQPCQPTLLFLQQTKLQPLGFCIFLRPVTAPCWTLLV